MAVSLTGANRHDVTELVALVDAVRPVRPHLDRAHGEEDARGRDSQHDAIARTSSPDERGRLPAPPWKNGQRTLGSALSPVPVTRVGSRQARNDSDN